MKKTSSSSKLWGGRFSEEMDSLVEEFNASISFDQKMAFEDIAGSIAHATMLANQNILTQAEAKKIIQGLESIAADITEGNISWQQSLEDIHMNIESELTKRIGELGGKLHTARSRNDQVATDFRLYLKKQNEIIIDLLTEVQRVFVELAEDNIDVIMPGYTHLQVAQPILFSHHMLAYYQMFLRDQSRFIDSLERMDVSPLGSGALAGTGFDIDPWQSAQLLGFNNPAHNSLDAISDRDFVIEFQANSSILIMHLSRLSEEMILWSSQEFSFMKLPDSHTTGSSIMPQKKNADVSELIRGKTGRIYGNLMGILTVMKGLPLAFNKDMQEDKEGAFDTAETIIIILKLLLTMMPKIELNKKRMYYAAGRAYSNATDFADYLAKKGMPFREAHEVVGKLVAIGIKEGKDLQDLSLTTMQEISELIEEDVFDLIRLEHVVNVRNSYGGTSTEQVKLQIANAKKILGLN